MQSIPTDNKYDPKPDVTVIVENVDNSDAKKVPTINAADAIGYCKIWA